MPAGRLPRFRHSVVLSIVVLFLLSILLPLPGAASGPRAAPLGALAPMVKPGKLLSPRVTPPTDAQCRAQFGIPCYSPQEMRQAYGVTPLINKGFTGTGQTIVIIDSFGSPTIAQDLKTFDAGYGLPDPPSFQVLHPLGVDPFDPNDPTEVSWAFETTLDVEWSHAMAPGASIILMTSPVAETEGDQGLPQFLKLEKMAVSQHLGQIISQSWGATENTVMDASGNPDQVVQAFEQFYQGAAGQGITILASAGDSGAANVNVSGQFFPFPTVIYPASSAWVTAVGGTSLHATTSGTYQNEIVWNNASGATGGGVSQLFAEPSYQTTNLPASDQTILNGHRGIPDVAYNADPNTSILVYVSFPQPPPNTPGYYFIGGTSEGSPQWAGIVADLNQATGHPLGYLNPMLYTLGNGSASSKIYHDITSGNNSFAGITGYNATTGWDPTTGWGSPKGAGSVVASLAGLR